MSQIHLQLDGAGFDLAANGFTLSARTLAPRFAGVVDAPLDFQPDGVAAATIGPMSGEILRQVATFAGCRVSRKIFQAADRTVVAVRLGVRNDNAASIELLSLVPAYAETLRVADADLADWRIVRAGRQKNDIPGNFRFTDDDIDFEHAKIDAAEFKAGSGVQASDLAKSRGKPDTVQADPYLWIKHRSDASRPGLFVGVLGQTDHLTQIYLQSTEDRRAFHSLAVTCEMDGITLQPGEERTSHWIVFWQVTDEEATRQRHVDLIAELMQIPKPKPPISYYCSWYFYGTDFTQADLDENLAGLRERPIPFDVMLIDNGWMDDFGSYNANERFPLGMQHAAEVIRQAGYRPGIWTCPFVIMKESPALAKFPNLIARDVDGNPVLFPYEKTKEWVVDPTSPDAEDYFAELFGKLKAWGFTAHKFDFLRAITSNPRIRFHDRSMNRAQAYRHGMSIIRRLVGNDAYILACGGLFEASAGMVDGMRVGSDTKGRWADPNATNAYHRMGYVVRIKQNVFRNHTNQLWHTDPDALQLRCRTTPFREKQEFFHLCEGSFTEDEAMSLVAHQYVGGGIVCLCERMAELPDHRHALLRRALPTVTPPARVIDYGHLECPTTFCTKVTPRWGGTPWATIVVFNWSDTSAERVVDLACADWLAGEPRLAVMELVTQKFLGLHTTHQGIPVIIPRHGCRVFRVAAWDGRTPMLLGTDGHFSGGAAELADFSGGGGVVDWTWTADLRITVGYPVDGLLKPVTTQLSPGRRTFKVSLQGVPAAP